jgi:TonB family C-terminal domain
MEGFFIYLIKSTILLSVIAIIYHLFLRQTTFLHLNRAYLLLGILASFALPLIAYSYDVIITTIPNSQEQLPIAEQLMETTGNAIDIYTILFIVYIAGIVLYLFKILSAYKKANSLIKRALIERRDGYKIVITKDVESPCSILNNVLINTENLSDTERKAILRHEITHIRQRHWIDLLCSECILLLQWFNPMTRFYISLLKENHEFLADRAVVKSGISPALYKAVLLNQRFNGPVFSFANSFDHSAKSKRLIMVTKEKSSAWKKLLILALIPVLTIHIWATAKPNYIVESQEKEPISLMDVDVKPKFDGNEDGIAFRKWVQENLMYPESAIQKESQGHIMVQFTISEAGDVKDVKILKGVSPDLDAEAMRAISDSPKWTPGKHEGKPVEVSYIFSIVFELR